MNDEDRLFMNPETGSVDTLEGWQADYDCSEEPDIMFPDGRPPAGLIEVRRDADGDWEEVDED